MTYNDETTLGELIEKLWETQMSTQGKQMKEIGRRGRGGGVIEEHRYSRNYSDSTSK